MPRQPPEVLGRYVLRERIASGGMASVYLARHQGPLGFAKTVAVKRLHEQYARNPEFVAMLLDEARLVARINHPNVAAVLDVVTAPEALCVVMEYLHGEDLSRLLARQIQQANGGCAPAVAAAIVIDALRGLHAAHEATDEQGRPLQLVHRDISPQNLFVGADGLTRVLDFGIAKATTRAQVTREGQVKGKLSYMSPEQLCSRKVDRRSDVFAAGVVLWEMLTGERLFAQDDPGAIMHAILQRPRPAPSEGRAEMTPQLDALVLRALAIEPEERFESAAEMASALEQVCRPAQRGEVAAWVQSLAGEQLAARQARVQHMESAPEEPAGEALVPTLASSLNDALVELAEREELAELPTAVDALSAPMHTTATPAAPNSSAARGPSELASAALPAESAWPPAQRSKRTLWLGLGTLIVLSGGALMFGAQSVLAQRSAALLPLLPSISMAVAEAPPSPAVSPQTAAAATAEPASATPEPANAAQRSPAPKAIPRPFQPKPARALKDGCSPRYYFKNGIKHYKRHCL